jgi:hypothetical protein
MIRIVFLRALFWTVVISSSASVASSQETYTAEEAINHPQNISLINLLKGSDRAIVIARIRELWVATGDVRYTKLLCQIDPWTLGNYDEDFELQKLLFEGLLEGTKTWDAAFAFADCAAANRENSHLDSVPDLMRDMRSAFLSTATDASWRPFDGQDAINRINAADAGLLRARKPSGPRSFYPLLNVQNKAQILAAEAVYLAKDDKSDEAKKSLLKAVQQIADWQTNDRYLSARDGFRYRNDLFFHKNFYLALLGEDGALDALKSMVTWPALLMDDTVSEALPPSVRAKLLRDDPSYVDPIYIGRLLPGVAETTDDEAYRWWQTSYPLRDVRNEYDIVVTKGLANTVVACFEGLDTEDLLERIVHIDACVGAYDTQDWRVELASFRGANTPSQRERAEAEKARLLRRIFKNDASDVIAHFEDDFGVEARDGRWFILTEQKYSRREIIMFARVLEKVRGLPSHRFFRQNVY